MKKLSYVFMGMLLGIALAISASAYADDIKSLVGLKVGSVWELRVDGETVGQVPIIKGSSYGPIRQIAEIAGLDVDFEPGVVLLESISEEVTGATGTPRSKDDVLNDIANINYQISGAETNVKTLAFTAGSDVQKDLSPDVAQFWMDEYNKAVNRLTELEAEKADLEAELAALQQSQ